MASKSGSNSNAIAQIATTWGTAVAAGAGDKLPAEISHSLDITELLSRQVGSGNSMITSATRGNTVPSVSITMDAGYQNGFHKLLAQMMGTNSVGAEITGGQGDYKHTTTFNTSLNAKYITVAYESSSATVHEFPTCAVTSSTIRTTSVPGYLEGSFELLANDLELSTAVNTNGVIAAATLSDSNIIDVAFLDDFRINTQAGGGLSGSDQLNITGFELTLNRPQQIVNEIKNSAGNSAPLEDGLFEGTLNITLRELADHTYYNIWSAETAQKCQLTFTGPQIGTGSNRQFDIYIPSMVMIEAPQYALVEPGINAVSYTFKLLKAAANPTGMSSTYPYFEVINTLSTSILA